MTSINLAADQPRPQDDFYRSINGEWINTYELPADRSRFGAFDKLAEDSEKAVKEILEDESTPAPKSTALYKSFLDTDALEKAGITPIENTLKDIEAVSSKEDLIKLLGTLNPAGGPSFLEIAIFADPGDPFTNIAHILQSGIGLPDEAYYRKDQYKPIREAYVTMIAKFFVLAGLNDEESAQQRALDFLNLETKIASHHWDNVTDRDDNKTYNPASWDELCNKLPHMNFAEWADAWQKSYDTTAAAQLIPLSFKEALSHVIIHEPSFLEGLDKEWDEQSLDSWKTWALAHVLMSSANYLTNDFETAAFDFYGRALSGTTQIRDRWKRGVALINNVSGEEVGREYVRRHFPASSKQKMETLVNNLLAAYRVSISNSLWLGEETKVKALEKLDLFTPMIGYTERWRDYSALDITAEHSLMENLAAANIYENSFQMSKAGKPVDKGEWLMNPQTVNAYYEPSMNVIVFPAAILQPPFFDPDADDATNYGGIGCVIGHEIGHGFDDQGSRYDGTGKLNDWWTDVDRENFTKLTKALIDQYSQLVPLQLEQKYAEEGKADQAPHVNGGLTIGENIGDLSGVNISLKAYVLSRGGKANNQDELEASLTQTPVIDGMTAVQRFFHSYATIWRTKQRDAFAEQLLAIDPHSPAEFRTNQIVKNVDAFYTAFDVHENDGMWLAPEDRVRIW